MLRQSAVIFVLAFLTIATARVLRGHTLGVAVVEGAAWATVSAVIFGVWDWRRRRRGEHCAVCDGPQEGPADR
jgi:hypothetical protein